MWRILEKCPGTYTLFKNETNFSSRTIMKHLKDLKKLGAIKQNYNLYLRVPEEEWCCGLEVSKEIASFVRFKILVYWLSKHKFLRKERGKRSDGVEYSGREEFERFTIEFSRNMAKVEKMK